MAKAKPKKEKTPEQIAAAKAKAEAKLEAEIASWAEEHKLQLIDPDAMVIRNILPGILVTVHCRMRGGRWTKRSNFESREADDGKVIEKWDSERIFDDKPEHDAADALRQKIVRQVKKLGVETAVGWIVPAYRKQELAQALSYGHARADKFNETSRSLDLIFRYGLYNVEGNSSGTIAAVTEQLTDILDKVNKAALSDEAEILQNATKGQLGDYKTAQAVISNASKSERMLIVANVRAAMARKAIGEVKNFSTLLPEEAGLAVTDMVGTLRKTASSWIKGAKAGDEAYETALNSFDADGVSSMQAALIKAATMADEKAQNLTETAALAGGELIQPNLTQEADEPETMEAMGAGLVGADLFKDSPDQE